MSVTLTVTVSDDHNELEFSASGSPSYVRIYRSSVAENGGMPFAISPNLSASGTFLDYNIASDVLYSYYAEAVSGGVGTQSSVAQASIHLAYTHLHATYKKLTTGNLYGESLSILTKIPHKRDYSRPTEAFKYAGAAKPEIRLAGLRKVTANLEAKITLSNDVARRTLRDIFEYRMYCCLRDSLGNKYFVIITDLDESYDFHTDIPIQFTQVAYSEVVPAGV